MQTIPDARQNNVPYQQHMIAELQHHPKQQCITG